MVTPFDFLETVSYYMLDFKFLFVCFWWDIAAFSIGLLFLQYCGKNSFKDYCTPCPVLNSALWLVGIETIPQEPPRTVSSNPFRHLFPCLCSFLTWRNWPIFRWRLKEDTVLISVSLPLSLFILLLSLSLSPTAHSTSLPLSFPPSCLAFSPVNSGCLDLPRFSAFIYPTPWEELWDLPESSPPALWSGSCLWAVHWDNSRATVGSLFFRE